MNDKVILGTVVMLVSLNSALPVMANQVQEAQNDAEVAVINQETVDAKSLRNHGDEYTREFLIQFHTATQRYRQAFQQGVTDQENGQSHSFAGRVENAAYQRGKEHGKAFSNNENGQVQEKAKMITPGEQSTDQTKYSVKQPLPDQARFINRIARHAQRIGKTYDLYPSVIIAQAALESNWGSSGLSLAPHHNLFGVKGQYAGHGVLKSTTEFINEQPLQVQDVFRSYADDSQSLQDYAETLQQPLYKHVHRSLAKDYREATRALVGCYATDPDYDKKLNQIIDSYQLTRYDNLKEEGNEHERVRNYQQLGGPTRSGIKKKQQQEKAKQKKISPVISVIGGAASAGMLAGLKKMMIS